MEDFIGHWGYLAVVLGTFFEGETIPVLAGFAAHQGYLRFDLVVTCAFAGSVTGDQTWFWIGRRFGRQWMERHPGKAAEAEKVAKLLDRWGDWFVLSFRFLYGLRAISPVALGLSRISALRFALLNLISALIWAVAVACLGYFFGNAAESVLGKLAQWEHRIVAAGIVTAILFVLHRLIRRRVLKAHK